MISVAKLVAELQALGVTGDALVTLLARIEEPAISQRSKAALRQERYRERHKASQSVTPLQRHKASQSITKRHAVTVGGTYKEGGRDLSMKKVSQEEKEKEGLPVTDAREAPTKKRGLTFLPDNFVADGTVEKVLDYFHLTGEERILCLDEIRDYWHGSGRMMKDWQAVFRNGVKRYVRVNRKGNGNGTASIIGHNQRVLAEAKRREANYPIRSREGAGRDLFLIQGRSETDE